MKMDWRRTTAGFPTCPRCGRVGHRQGARFCGTCGKRVRYIPDSHASDNPQSVFGGLAFALSGLMLLLWVSRHSPHVFAPEMEATALLDPGAYYIKEPAYSLIILGAAASVLWGIIRIVRALIDGVKR